MNFAKFLRTPLDDCFYLCNFMMKCFDPLSNKRSNAKVFGRSNFELSLWNIICVAARKIQKQPSEVFCKNRCSSKIHKIHRKTPVFQSLFNKVAGLQACNFIKKRLQHSCFPAKFANFLRTPILKNICEQLLLKI